VYLQVKNETRTQTQFYIGQVQVTGAKMYPNPHLSDAKPMVYLKLEPELPSLEMNNKIKIM
jgi:hypothetical protein